MPKTATDEPLSREALEQLSSQELVEVILAQQSVIRHLCEELEEQRQEIERLKAILGRDSRSSSKPPST
ncbi:MAG: hypothetical protein F6K19_36555, partial [Cyanothece sp. SIO1E1]|nr:hypothetical protein [Cyanothece sp. SIO1E1]